MNVYPSACTSQGLLKDREGPSEDFTDVPLVNTHVHAVRSDIHTLSAHMPPLTLMADSLVGTKNNTHTHTHSRTDRAKDQQRFKQFLQNQKKAPLQTQVLFYFAPLRLSLSSHSMGLYNCDCVFLSLSLSLAARLYFCYLTF